MRLICPNCGAQYEVPDDVIPSGGRDVQCSNCGHTWLESPGASVAAEEDFGAETTVSVADVVEGSSAAVKGAGAGYAGSIAEAFADIDTDEPPVDMPDTMQRVMLLLAFNVPDIGQFSTEIARAEWRKRALKALEPLTAVQPPVITNLTITMSTSRPGSDDADIDFVDNSTGRRAGVSVGATGTTVRL